MLKGLCINKGNTTVLTVGKQYFLFPNGEHHYYVSMFPNQRAHKGCFESSLFQLISDNDQQGKEIALSMNLDKDKLYRARLIWKREGYNSIELKEYFLVPHKTHADFYDDQALKVCRGCFPLHWFTDFLEVAYIIEETEKEKEIAVNCKKLVPPENENQDETYEQLTFF